MQVVLYCDNRMGATPVKCTYSQTIGTQFSDSMQVRMMMLMMMLMMTRKPIREKLSAPSYQTKYAY